MAWTVAHASIQGACRHPSRRREKIDARVRDILKAALARTVTLGCDLAKTAVQAARQGVVDVAEAILSNVPKLVESRADPIKDLDRERTTLHSEASTCHNYDSGISQAEGNTKLWKMLRNRSRFDSSVDGIVD